MVFSSLEFIFVFLPIFLFIYFIFPDKYKNFILLFMSIIFYYLGVKEKPIYLLLIIVSVFINYILGIYIGKNKNGQLLFILGIIYNLSWLLLFKYYNFFSLQINNIFNTNIPIIQFILPLGISFYTFQMLSYLIDVYKEKYLPEKSLIKFSTYVLMFPKLILGPITNYSLIKGNLDKKQINLNNIVSGIKYFTIGLGCKVLLANRIDGLWNDVLMIGFDSVSTPLALLGIVSYSLQLYFDFYGYSIMAIGLGKIIGFKLPHNFDYPYMSLSMTEFWRRWHMTLGNWFKEYIYFPLGGSHSGLFKTILNLFIVWLLTGLWHGASWNFIIWSISLFIIILIEKLFLKKYLEKLPLLGHIYMIIMIPLSWLIFAVSDISQIGTFFTNNSIFTLDYIKYLKAYGLLLIIGVFFSTKLPFNIYIKFKKKFKYIDIIIVLIIFWLSIYCLCIERNDPFMYFNF